MLMFKGLDSPGMRLYLGWKKIGEGRLLDCIDYTGQIDGGVLAFGGLLN